MPLRTNNSRLFLLCAGVAVGALGLAGWLAIAGPRPDPWALVFLIVLTMVAANASVELPNESAMSASFMLSVAAVVVFHRNGQLLGPLLVGMAAGIYLPHLRERQLQKFIFNVGNLGLSTVAAAAVYSLVPNDMLASVPGQLAASIPTGLTFSLVNFLFLTLALSIHERRSLGAVASELWLGDLQIYPFAIMGVLLGRLYVELGAWVVPLFVAPIFIAKQTFASYRALRDAQDATLLTLVRTLEAKDRYTAGHVERVARFAHLVGLELGMRPARLERLRCAALMHDIGKLIVPNQILNKPERLTVSEYERLRHHEAVSVELLRRIDFLRPVAPSIEAEMLATELGALGLPLEARIIAVADAFDAMTSTRAYRRALSQEVAFEELREKSGSQFDPACVETLISVLERSGATYGAGHETDVATFAVPPPARGTGSAGLGDLALDETGVTK
jgi:hypothetical protein